MNSRRKWIFIAEPNDLDMKTNRTLNNLTTFQIQLDNFKSSLRKQFSSFKQSPVAEVSKTPQKIYFVNWKNIFFLHEELKSKNTVINLINNADLKISLYVCVHIKTIPWKFRILNPENSRVVCPQVCKFLKK